MDMDQHLISISDLGLAAALVSCGYEIQQISRDIDNRAYFIFNQSEQLGLAILEYWADSLNVRARKYFDSIKMLKSRIYTGK
jgi:hypothetical protein